MKCGIAAEVESDLGRDQYANSVKFNPRLGISTSTSTDGTHREERRTDWSGRRKDQSEGRLFEMNALSHVKILSRK